MKLIDQDIGQYVYKHMCIRYIHVYINSAMSLLISFIAFPAQRIAASRVWSLFTYMSSAVLSTVQPRASSAVALSALPDSPNYHLSPRSQTSVTRRSTFSVLALQSEIGFQWNYA